MAEKDIDAGPEQLVVCERADIPGSGTRVVGVCRILLASDFVARGIAMDPNDAARSGRVFDELDVDAAVAAAANQDEIAVLVGEVEIGDLRDLSEQAAGEGFDQGQLIAERAVVQRVPQDANRAGRRFKISRHLYPDPLLERRQQIVRKR